MRLFNLNYFDDKIHYFLYQNYFLIGYTFCQIYLFLVNKKFELYIPYDENRLNYSKIWLIIIKFFRSINFKYKNLNYILPSTGGPLKLARP